jgi:hypothetical protein
MHALGKIMGRARMCGKTSVTYIFQKNNMRRDIEIDDEPEDPPSEVEPSLKRSSEEEKPVPKRIRTAPRNDNRFKAESVTGNIISVYGLDAAGKPEVWYYLLEQNFEGILLQQQANRFFTTATTDPIEYDTVLNWNVDVVHKKDHIHISAREQREQEEQLQFSLATMTACHRLAKILGALPRPLPPFLEFVRQRAIKPE